MNNPVTERRGRLYIARDREFLHYLRKLQLVLVYLSCSFFNHLNPRDHSYRFYQQRNKIPPNIYHAILIVKHIYYEGIGKTLPACIAAAGGIGLNFFNKPSWNLPLSENSYNVPNMLFVDPLSEDVQFLANSFYGMEGYLTKEYQMWWGRGGKMHNNISRANFLLSSLLTDIYCTTSTIYSNYTNDLNHHAILLSQIVESLYSFFSDFDFIHNFEYTHIIMSNQSTWSNKSVKEIKKLILSRYPDYQERIKLLFFENY